MWATADVGARDSAWGVGVQIIVLCVGGVVCGWWWACSRRRKSRGEKKFAKLHLLHAATSSHLLRIAAHLFPQMILILFDPRLPGCHLHILAHPDVVGNLQVESRGGGRVYGAQSEV